MTIGHAYKACYSHSRVETGSRHAGHPGHILSGSSGSDPDRLALVTMEAYFPKCFESGH